MNRYYFHLIMLTFCGLLIFSSCSEQKQKPVEENVPLMELSSQDTTTVRDLAIEFIELLKNQKYDDALAKLEYLDTAGVIVPLPDELKARQRFVFEQFPVLSYKIDTIIFRTEYDTHVKYTFEFFEKEDSLDTRPNTISSVLRPMRQDGEWHLTMFDSATSNSHSEIKH